MPYISYGWDFSTLKNFPKETILAADTETKTYQDGELQSEEDLYLFYKFCMANKQLGFNHFRSKIEVRGYAFMISNGVNFALFQCIEDFITCITQMNTKRVIWYNTRFDFTLFDYHFLKNNWINKADIMQQHKGQKGKIKPCDKMFSSLNGEYGQRYRMEIWKEYSNKSGHKKIHKTTMIDLCNILGGGLRKNLENFDVKDENGNDIRKLEMDYVNADLENENDIQYMINDTKGLYYLAKKFDDACKEISGLSFLDGDYMTAGGLAKKSMLRFMFNPNNSKTITDKDCFKEFKKHFPMNKEIDKEFRLNYLYKGGCCLINPQYTKKILTNVHKYDENSMYPHKEKTMKLPYGSYKIYSPENLEKFDNKKCYILKLKYLHGYLKENKIPFYMDCITNDFVDEICETHYRYIWYEELKMYEIYYEMEYEIEKIYEFDAVYSKGLIKFVDNFYVIKCTTTNPSFKQTSKTIINSSYGKFSQNVNPVVIKYQINENGYLETVKFYKNGEEISDNDLMSIFVGSRITALARVDLGLKIDYVCKGNSKKYFVYCDTDSIHALRPYKNTDGKILGMLKNEGTYKYAYYLAPKTYIMQDADGKYEVHCKGVNTDVVKNEVLKEKNFFDVINNVFKPNRQFKCLNCLNVVGGRALFYVDKVLLNETNNDSELINLTSDDIIDIDK